MLKRKREISISCMSTKHLYFITQHWTQVSHISTDCTEATVFDVVPRYGAPHWRVRIRERRVIVKFIRLPLHYRVVVDVDVGLPIHLYLYCCVRLRLRRPLVKRAKTRWRTHLCHNPQDSHERRYLRHYTRRGVEDLLPAPVPPVLSHSPVTHSSVTPPPQHPV